MTNRVTNKQNDTPMKSQRQIIQLAKYHRDFLLKSEPYKSEVHDYIHMWMSHKST